MRSTFFLTLFLLHTSAQAYIVNGSMGREPESSLGQCLSAPTPHGNEPAEILSRQAVRASKNISNAELLALSTGIKQIEFIYGGAFPGVRGARFMYRDEDHVWNQSSGDIHVNRYWSNDTGMSPQNIGMLMHELGHYVGNNKAEDNPISYGKYFRAVPSPCHFSWYSEQSRNEEFADVFSAFLVNPDLLLRADDENCVLAYRFLKKSLHLSGELSSCRKDSKKKSGPKQKQVPSEAAESDNSRESSSFFSKLLNW